MVILQPGAMRPYVIYSGTDLFSQEPTCFLQFDLSWLDFFGGNPIWKPEDIDAYIESRKRDLDKYGVQAKRELEQSNARLLKAPYLTWPDPSGRY